jgi:diacylglycerol kinase family enzyme
MRAVLIYNPNSGSNGNARAEELISCLAQQGFETYYEETNAESDLDPILRDADDLLVVAGGDGTLRAVATRVAGKGVPIALIPMGTANNIARALNIEGSYQEIIAGLKNPQRKSFDLGRVHTPSGSYSFLEAFGYGYYATGLAAYRPEEGKSILRSLAAFAGTVTGYSAEACRMVLDGEDITGSYLLFAMLNTPAFGPRMKFAPNADPGDGFLDVVCISEEGRENLAKYISSLINEEIDTLPSVQTGRGRKLEMIWSGAFPLHADAEVIPALREPDNPGLFPVSAEIVPGALEMWLPGKGVMEAGSGIGSEQDDR